MRLTTRPGRRDGKILVLFVLLLTPLLGFVGLTVDGGMMMAAHRQVQNAADGAALAAGMELLRGSNAATAQAAATTFVQSYNGLSNATVTVNIPPSSGPNAGKAQYAEVIVRRPFDTIFMRAAGGPNTTHVSARSVSGFESVSTGEGAIVFDPNARPGIAVSGGATLLVNGSVVVNSMAAGVDQYGVSVNWGLQQYAMSTGNNSLVVARYMQVRGGVDVWQNYWDYSTYMSRQPNPSRQPTDPCPLFCRAALSSDPLRTLPAPTQSNVTGISNWTRQAAISLSSNQTMTFNPGVYEDIQVNNGATVTFNPGVYIFSPTKANQGLRLNGSCTVTGNGVMFYMTGSNYLDVSPGFRDTQDDAQAALDGPLPPTNAASVPPSTDPSSGSVKFATFACNASGAVNLTGLNNASSPFNGMLIFQRRRNTSTASIAGGGGQNVNLAGTIYAKWALFTLSGGGSYNAQFLVGSLSVSGQAAVTINSTGKNFGRANQVFLVE